MKTHTIKTYNPDMKSAYLSNGLIGLRIGAIPLGTSKALVNGYCRESRYEYQNTFERILYNGIY
jgi:hypothetical protein